MLPNLRRRRTALRRLLPALVATLGLTATTLAVTSVPANAFLLPTTTTVSTAVPASLVGTPVTIDGRRDLPAARRGHPVPRRQGHLHRQQRRRPGRPRHQQPSGPPGCILNLPILPPCRVTLTTAALPVGNVTITAKYGGDLLARASTGTAP